MVITTVTLMCAACKWTWRPRTENPVQCPHCKVLLRLIEPIVITEETPIVGDVGDVEPTRIIQETPVA